MSIEEALQMIVSVAIGLVAICVIIKAMEWLIKDKSDSPKPSSVHDIGGYQPIHRDDLSGVRPQPPKTECKEPRIEYPINNLKEARLMLKQHYTDRETIPKDTMGCNYTAIWCDEWININSIIIRLDTEEYINNKYNLINQK